MSGLMRNEKLVLNVDKARLAQSTQFWQIQPAELGGQEVWPAGDQLLGLGADRYDGRYRNAGQPLAARAYGDAEPVKE